MLSSPAVPWWDLRREPGEGEAQTERAYLLARRSPIALRPAAEADREFLRALHHACFRRWVEPIWGWDESDQDRRVAAAFTTEGRSIVELDGRAIGTVRTVRGPEEVFLADLEVAPEHQGRGIGARLLRRVLAATDAAGLPVRLQVLRGNPARRLYERHGFTVERETPERVHMTRDRPSPHAGVEAECRRAGRSDG